MDQNLAAQLSLPISGEAELHSSTGKGTAGVTQTTLYFPDNGYVFQTYFILTDRGKHAVTCPVILGRTFLQQGQLRLDYTNSVFDFRLPLELVR
jgi:hypothetical protein